MPHDAAQHGGAVITDDPLERLCVDVMPLGDLLHAPLHPQ
jgi:hypothetical protein